MQIKITKPATDKYDNTHIDMSIEAEQLEDILSFFGDFLRAAGFVLKGEIVVDDEEYYDNLEKLDQYHMMVQEKKEGEIE